MKVSLASALVGVLLAVGFAGRVARALADAEDTAATHEARVESFLQAHGWRSVQRVPITSDFTYSAQVFVRPGCWEPLLVSLAGSGLEAAGLYSQQSGGREWAFVRNGVYTPDPPALRFMLDQIVSRVTPGGRAPAPILALSEPRREAGACRGPTPDEWRQLGGG